MPSMKIEYAREAIPVGAKTKDTGYYPTITLGDAAAKQIKEYGVGDECTLTMKGVVKSISEDEGSGRRLVFEARECECADEDDEFVVDDDTAKKVAKMAMKKRVA